MSKPGSQDRRDLIYWALDRLGSRPFIAVKTGVSHDRLRKWVHEGFISLGSLPELIPLQKQANVKLPWVLLVNAREAKTRWTPDRRRLQRIFVLLGGQARIAEDLGLTAGAVKHWGRYARVPEKHLGAFLKLCQRRVLQYTGQRIIIKDCVLTGRSRGQSLDIFKLHSHFVENGLLFNRRSE